MKLLNKHDPQALIHMGAPPDEYENEAKLILADLNKCQTSEQVNALVFNVFYSQFGILSGAPEDYENLSNEIYRVHISNKFLRRS